MLIVVFLLLPDFFVFSSILAKAALLGAYCVLAGLIVVFLVVAELLHMCSFLANFPWQRKPRKTH